MAYVINRGNMWHIIERSTGETIAFRQSYKVALEVAEAWSK